MDKTQRLVQLQEIQNEVKKKLRKAFAKIDDKKTGFVKLHAFNQICQVLQVKFAPRDQAKCERQYEKNGSVNYAEVLRVLGLNPQTETWELRNLQSGASSDVRNLRKSRTM